MKIIVNNFKTPEHLMVKKINNYIVGFLYIFLIILLNSCNDIFLRFKYQTIECQENSFNLKKISIKNDKAGHFADVQFGDFYHKIEILENNAEWIFLGKISIKNEKEGSFADVQFGNFYHKIQILRNDPEKILLGNKKLDLEVGIYKDSEKIEVRLKNIIKNLKCKRNTFRM